MICLGMMSNATTLVGFNVVSESLADFKSALNFANYIP
jgi:hypothetical protein